MQKGAELLKKVHINWWAKRKVTALSTAEQVNKINMSSLSVVNPHYTAVCRHLYLLNILHTGINTVPPERRGMITIKVDLASLSFSTRFV